MIRSLIAPTEGRYMYSVMFLDKKLTRRLKKRFKITASEGGERKKVMGI